MKSIAKKLTIFALLALGIFVVQVSTIATSFAADAPTDLNVYVMSFEHDHALQYRICNEGPTPVSDISVTNDFTNFAPTEYLYFFFSSQATNPGTVDSNGNWSNGLLEGTNAPGGNQCLYILVNGTATGGLGSSIGLTTTVTSATLEDSSANIDTNTANDSYSYISNPLTPEADMALDTRLLTTGEITAGQDINYELTISNHGPGDYVKDALNSDDNVTVFFLMPAGATFNSMDDTDTNDNLDIMGCFAFGSIHQFGPQMAQYDGDVEGCAFGIHSGNTIPSGASYSFQANVHTTTDFVSGETHIGAMLDGGDAGTVEYINAVLHLQNFFELDSNNINNLTFDATDLIPTVNPCAGQGTTVSVNDACFTISFNKDIYGPSFTADDLVLTGGGTISSFAETSHGVWTVHVTGMTPGGTLTVSLAEGGIQDLSAVSNGVQVLGINTVKYETPSSGTPSGSTSANGTLAETGKNVDWITPVLLLLLGLVLLKWSRKKTVSDSQLASLEHSYHN